MPRVHAGIRPSRSDDRDFLSEDDRKRLFNLLLDRRSVGLDLPAAEGRTVIGKLDEKTHRKKYYLCKIVQTTKIQKNNQIKWIA
jgi:hypothetical protein